MTLSILRQNLASDDCNAAVSTEIIQGRHGCLSGVSVEPADLAESEGIRVEMKRLREQLTR